MVKRQYIYQTTWLLTLCITVMVVLHNSLCREPLRPFCTQICVYICSWQRHKINVTIFYSNSQETS